MLLGIYTWLARRELYIYIYIYIIYLYIQSLSLSIYLSLSLSPYMYIYIYITCMLCYDIILYYYVVPQYIILYSIIPGWRAASLARARTRRCADTRMHKRTDARMYMISWTHTYVYIYIYIERERERERERCICTILSLSLHVYIYIYIYTYVYIYTYMYVGQLLMAHHNWTMAFHPA